MALILEDGSTPDGANAYADIDFADGYLGDRAFADWPPGASEDKEAALVKAADYLNGLSWHGRKAKAGRVMAWPRADCADSDGYAIEPDAVPYAVKAANAYLARLVFTGVDLQPVLERGGRVQTEKVGTLSTTYFDDSPVRDVYSALADLLRGLAFEFDEGAGSSPNGVTIVKTTV